MATRLTSPLFEQLVESRDAQFGALAGVAFAEGVVVKDLIVRPDLFKNRRLSSKFVNLLNLLNLLNLSRTLNPEPLNP